MNRKSINSTNILIGICIVLIIIFSLGIICIFNKTMQNLELLEESMITIAGTLSSLIVASVSLIALLMNRKNTLATIKQSENNLFIQLRYEKAYQGINDLLILIDLTIGIYKQIQHLNKRDIPEKNEYLSPRSFLIMQFINIISNYELMIKLPITLRIKLETDLINKYDENASKKINDDEQFSELLKELEFINDYKEQYQIIKSSRPTYKIKNSIKYNQFIKEFNEYEDYEMHENMFMWYYGFKKIRTEDIFNHFNELREEIVSNSIEYLILKDKFE